MKFFCNYLSNSTQSVFCNEPYSLSDIIKAGVPQGSILGPLLFLVYIDDIANASSKLKYIIYADDTSLLISDRDLFNLHKNLQTELEFINLWVKANSLTINTSKTNYILFQNRSLNYQMPPLFMEGNIVKNVTHIKFLGVHIDKNLNWSYHINDVYSKLSRMCGILYKIRNHLTTEALLCIYYTLCYPHFVYCVSLWASTWPSFITKVKIGQNKINNQGNQMFKLLDSSYSTKQQNVNVLCPQYCTTLFKHCMFYYGPYLWNNLPIDVKSHHLGNPNQFKKKLKKHFLTLQNA